MVNERNDDSEGHDEDLIDEVTARLEQSGINVSGDGVFQDDLSLRAFLASPMFHLWDFSKVVSTHPEVHEYQWAGSLSLPGVPITKVIVEYHPQVEFYSMFLGSNWEGFTPRQIPTAQAAQLREQTQVAYELPSELAATQASLWRCFQEYRQVFLSIQAQFGMPYTQDRLRAEVAQNQLLTKAQNLADRVARDYSTLPVSR